VGSFVSLARFEADLRMGSVAERFVIRVAATAERHLLTRRDPMTARPHDFDLTNDEIRTIDAWGNSHRRCHRSSIPWREVISNDDSTRQDCSFIRVFILFPETGPAVTVVGII
jgi:hypothetical protein